MLRGFRDFILRGNVLDLAVAVVIGTAFGAVVTALVEGFITPLIALVGGLPDASALNTGAFAWGTIINAILNFLLTAAVVYFLVVAPMNRLMLRMAAQTEVDEPPAPTKEEILLSEIRDLLRQRAL